MVAVVTLSPFLFFVIQEKIAASKYTISDEGQDYVTACKGAFAASWRKDSDLLSYLKFMHYPLTLRGCSCAATHITASQPDDVEAAHIIFVAVTKALDDASGDVLFEARALGEELGISEARLTELVNANGDAFRACF